MNELVLIPQEKALDVFKTANGLDPYLQEIRKEIDSFIPDITTEKGRKEVASMAFKVAKSKTALDEIGKNLVAELKEVPKLIDAERKRMRELLDSWKDEVRKPLTDFEQKESVRLSKHEQAVQAIADMCIVTDLKAWQIKELLNRCDSFVIDASWEEFESKAAGTLLSTQRTLKEMLSKQEKIEAEQAELVRIIDEAIEREQKAREESIAKEAAENARKAAEVKVKAELEKAARAIDEQKKAAENAEIARIEAVQRAERAEKDAQENAKREQEAAAKRQADELAKREANKKHLASINNKAVSDIVENCALSEHDAKAVITAIAKGLISNVKINY